MTRRARRIVGSLVLGLGAGVALPLALVLLSRDAPPPDDSDLEPARLELAAGENAFPHLQEAASRLDWPEESEARPCALLRAGAEARPEARALLARNRAAFAALERALAARALKMPPFEIPPSARRARGKEVDPVLTGARRLSKLLALRSEIALAEGRVEAAEADAQRALRLGHRLVAARNGGLLAAVVGVQVKRAGLAALHARAMRAPLGPERARALAASLERFRPAPEAWKAVWAAEYRSLRAALHPALYGERSGDEDASEASEGSEARGRGLLDGLTLVLLSTAPSGYVLQPHRTLAAMASDYRALREQAGGACADLDPASAPSLPDSFLGRVGFLLSPNGVGRWIRSMSLPEPVRFQAQRCELASRVAATRARLALAAWEEERGSLPEALDALVPRLLPGLPRDGFDGAPLRYRPEARLLYSAGRDLRDPSGRRERGSLAPEELTYPLDAEGPPGHCDEAKTSDAEGGASCPVRPGSAGRASETPRES